MKKVKIGCKNYSRLVCGTNAFYGRSHFSAAKDNEYKSRFTDEYIEHALRACLARGINTVETSANERIHRIVSKIRGDSELNLIGSTRVDETSEMRSHQQKLKFLLEIKADICVVHSQFTDKPARNNEILGLRAMIEKTHAAGLTAAVSTNKVSSVEICENRGYGVDVYLFPLNRLNYLYCGGLGGDDDLRERINIIKSVAKPFILFGTLAAGRIPPKEGLEFALANSKESDLITLGMGSLAEIEESAGIFETIVSGGARE
jgi:hypothetical protein